LLHYRQRPCVGDDALLQTPSKSLAAVAGLYRVPFPLLHGIGQAVANHLAAQIDMRTAAFVILYFGGGCVIPRRPAVLQIPVLCENFQRNGGDVVAPIRLPDHVERTIFVLRIMPKQLLDKKIDVLGGLSRARIRLRSTRETDAGGLIQIEDVGAAVPSCRTGDDAGAWERKIIPSENMNQSVTVWVRTATGHGAIQVTQQFGLNLGGKK
jgi:hypothetical protein